MSGLQQTLSQLQGEARDEIGRFHPALLAALAAAGVPEAAASGLQGAQSDGTLGALQAAIDALKESAGRQQRELSPATACNCLQPPATACNRL